MKKSQLRQIIKEEISNLLNEDDSKKPGDKFKIKGDYYIPTSGDYNQQIGNEVEVIEYVKDASKDEGFFRIEGMKKIFRINKSKYNRLIKIN